MGLSDRTSSDVPNLVTVLRRVHSVDGYPTVWPDDPVGWLVNADTLSEPGSLKSTGTLSPDMSVLTALVRGHEQRFGRKPADRSPSDLAEVTRLFIDPEQRGTGIGQRLLRVALDAVHRCRLWPVLDVRNDGRARATRLYSAAGWRFVGTAPRHLSADLVLPFDP